ncbi:hypothetical protein M3Y97_01013200 [Aphelenchoides bicaudatus]|nr:hypothetical protein M3Y97_01013200 [Aphelenchoides bicaudatus]
MPSRVHAKLEEDVEAPKIPLKPAKKDRDKSKPARPFIPDMNPRNVQSLHSDNVSLWRKITRRYIRPFRSCSNFRDSLIGFFPIIDWIPRYSWKRQFYGDFIGGLLFAITNIPQAIAYSLLAGIPAVSGIYSMLIVSVTYPLLATFCHGGPAPFSIMALMAGATADDVIKQYTNANGTAGYPPELVTQVTAPAVVSTLTFTIGLIFLICGIVRIQFLAEYFSAPLVSGFITGASFHIAIGQMDQVMGVKKGKEHRRFLFDVKALYDLAPQANYATLIMSGSAFLFLVIGKFVLHPRLERLCPNRTLIIPYELILVVVSTVLSGLLSLGDTHHVKTIGPIPRDLPVPALPKFFLIKDLIWDAFALAVIQAAIHMSVSKMMSAKKGYRVDDNQGIFCVVYNAHDSRILASISVGIGVNNSGVHGGVWSNKPVVQHNIRNCCFGCFIGSWPASSLASDGKPFKCILAIIVLIPLRILIMGFADVPQFWRQCRWDFCVWLVTFVSTVCIDVIYGLGVGIGFELFTIVARTQGPTWTAWYTKETEDLDICVFQFESMLLFTNGERFKKAVRQVFGRWHTDSKNQTRIFIFDCSSITEVDSVGLKCFTQILSELRKTDSIIYFVKASNYHESPPL